jgi:hypothetical protein
LTPWWVQIKRPLAVVVRHRPSSPKHRSSVGATTFDHVAAATDRRRRKLTVVRRRPSMPPSSSPYT